MNKSILVVEDDAVVALDIQQTLQSLGYTVAGHATTAHDAIQLAKAAKPDLILMDIVLKGPEDGVYAAEQVYAILGTPVVFLTGLGDEATLQRAKMAHPYGYILKPFDEDDLRLTVEIALHRASVDRTPSHSEQLEDDGINLDLGTISDDARGRLEILLRNKLFHGVERSMLERLSVASRVIELDAGAHLSSDAGAPLHVGIVVSGRMAVVKGTAAGKELIVGLLGPGDWYGLRAITGNEDDGWIARSQTDVKAVMVPVEDLRGVMASSTALAGNVATELAARLDRAHLLASSLAHARVEHRIVSTLLSLLPEFGKSSKGSNAMRIYITRKELAELTGTTPESAIRTTKHLEREGYLDLTRPGIIKVLDPNALAKLLS